MDCSAYLDHNATTPIRPEAIAAVRHVLDLVGNPSSVHRHGRVLRRLVERAREQIAALVGAVPGEVVFTSGGTEANALAIRGCGRERVLVSAVEHASVLGAVAGAERIPVDVDGVVDLAALAAMLATDPHPALVSVMLVNNETGVVQPVEEVVRIARAHGALVHCDAIQAAGKIAVEVGSLDVDLLSLSGHKLGGPAGCGALIVRGGVTLTPLLRGGGQEGGRRAGTENVPGIAGFGAAAEAAAGQLGYAGELAILRDRIERRLREIAPEAQILGAGAPRVANTSCIATPGMAAETQVIALDLAGVAVSAGAACSSGTITASHVPAAMGVDDAVAGSAIRISLGWTSREHDVDRFLDAWQALYRRVGERCRRSDGSRIEVRAEA